MPYTNDDPVMAKLEDAGAAVVMPAGRADRLRPRNPQSVQHRIILETVSVPVIVDAGVGTASDAAIAMFGCEGVLMNTAISGAQDRSTWPAMRIASRPGAWPSRPVGSARSSTRLRPRRSRASDWTS